MLSSMRRLALRCYLHSPATFPIRTPNCTRHIGVSRTVLYSTSTSAPRPDGSPVATTHAIDGVLPHGQPLERIAKPDFLDAKESAIWDLLAAEFAPSELQVRDVSGGCGSMYSIDITSDKFKGQSVLRQQRMVNSVLGDMIRGWHGLQLRTKATE